MSRLLTHLTLLALPPCALGFDQADRTIMICAPGGTPWVNTLLNSMPLSRQLVEMRAAEEATVKPSVLDAVSQTLGDRSSRRLRINDLGVVGDGTDEASRFQAAATAAARDNGRGGGLVLDSWAGYTLGSTVALPPSQQWRGENGTTGLRCTVASANCLTLTGSAASLRGFPIFYTGTAGTSSIGVQVGTGPEDTAMALRDLLFSGFGTGIDIQSGVAGKLDNVTVYGSAKYGIRKRNTTNSDAGDDVWTGLLINQPSGSNVRFESGGGLKVFGLKSLHGDIGWDQSLPDTTNTSVLAFVGNSIEGAALASMKFARSGTTGSFGTGTIVGNEFAGSPRGLWFADASHYNFYVGGNVFGAIGTVPGDGPDITIDPGAKDIVVGKNASSSKVFILDNRTAFADERGFLDRSDTVPIRNYDAATWSTAYTIKMPAYRGASVHVVLEGIVQGVGAFVRDEEFLIVSNAPGNPVAVTTKSSTPAGGAIMFRVDTASVPGSALIQYRATAKANGFDGTATILPLGKMVSVSR